nr:pseudouridylate synthase RPUSD4, mitochondrial-like [Lytechinus pictus]
MNFSRMLDVFGRVFSLTRATCNSFQEVIILSPAKRRLYGTTVKPPQEPSNQADSVASGQRDVFVDGDAKEKRTLRRKLEKLALSPDADLSQSSVVAARIRKQLKASIKAQKPVKEKEDILKKKRRDLRYQTRDLSRLSVNVVAEILRDRVIFEKDDIIALDKPYGLPVHGGPGMKHSIDSLLPKLSNLLNKKGTSEELHLIHRLDKETTGVILLARTERTARVLHEMFRKRQIIKQYLVITVGIPSPKEGILDMPMTEKEIDGKHRMVIRPDMADLYPDSVGVRSGRRNRDSQEALTRYKVLNERGNCALVQLEPETGVKHQIRVHLAQGLGCPILGDHKYSHHDRLAPQKLTPGILQSLGISQPKARTVPMHLHARQLVIPEIFDKHNYFISTRVPWFFRENMKRLKLKYDT